MASVKLKGVSKSYGKHSVVSDFSIEIRDGECFTFLGPSGCGKTVVLRLIAGFEQPEAGEVWIGDTLVSCPAKKHSLPPERRRIGVVFQDYAVWPHKTVYENVIYPLTIQKRPPEEAAARAKTAVEMVNLGALKDRLPYQLSGGQQQRVALARALVSKPEIMLLDEPLSNLDANLREEMRFEIKELQKNTGVTILYVTHDQEVALAISDRIAVMDGKGIVRQIGTPDEIYEKPADAFVFRFMGVTNFIPVERRDGALYVEGANGSVIDHAADWGPALQGKKIVAGCRPHDIRLSESGSVTRGVVKRAAYLGSCIDYRIQLGEVEVRVQQDVQEVVGGQRRYAEGETVCLDFVELKWFERPETLTLGAE